MGKLYDLAIIGGGPGGYVAAIRAGQLGLSTVVIEKDEKLGGTCLNRGCIPTKAILHSAEMFDGFKNASKFGIQCSKPSLDISELHKYKDRIVGKNAKGIEYLFRKNKVERILGWGKIVDKGKIEVSKNGDKTIVEAKNIIVATGSVVREIPVAKFDGERVLSSDEILEFDRVYKSIVVVGAGAVGVEFASIFNSFGSKVYIVEMMPRILPLEDSEISKELEKSFRKRGIEVYTSSSVTEVSVKEEGVLLKLATGSGEKLLESEVVLIAVGRAPATKGIGLETVGIEMDKGFIKVDKFMRTNVENIFAIGDVIPTPQLAHVASAEGIVAVEFIAGLDPHPINYDHVPSCTYCSPEVASIGLTEEEAKSRGYDIKVGKFPFTALGKAAILGKQEGFVKVVGEKKYDELLGVHIIGPHATDLISEAGVALKIESTVEELALTMHPHPTLSEAIMEAAHDTLGSAIHI